MEKLICGWCKKEKPVTEFFKRSQVKRGYSGYCKECASNGDRKVKHATKQFGKDEVVRILEQLNNGNKKCADCGEVKPVDQFYKDSRNFTGYMSYCKKCHGAQVCGQYVKYKKDKCEICGFVPVHSCQLEVDHIDGDHENNQEENFQTLCVNCHRLKTNEKELWEQWKARCLGRIV